MKLTARAIDAASAKDQTYVLWDHDLGGFGVRIWPGGAKTFVLKTRVGQGRAAKQSWVTIGRVGPLRLEDARRQALQIIAGAAKGVDPKPAKPLVPEVPGGPETVGELCEHWLLKGSLRSRQWQVSRKTSRPKEHCYRSRTHQCSYHPASRKSKTRRTHPRPHRGFP
jgi:hypothetical protein